jgi:copper(I)-binding protein
MKTKICLILSLLCSHFLFTQAASADVQVKEGYLRAVPPGQMMSAAFMELTNNTDKDITIVGGASPSVKAIEVHNHTKVDGVMKMRRIPSLVIESGKSVILKPGGLHIMFIGLKDMLKDGNDFSFDLTFENGETQSLTLPIKSIVKP